MVTGGGRPRGRLLLFDQHVRRWASRRMPSSFSRREFRLFYELLVRDFALTGKLHFAGLYLGDRPIALHLGFATTERFYHYKPTFALEMAPYSPGKLLLYELLRQASADGRRIFDFLLGMEPYKLLWTATVCANEEYRLYRDNLGGRIINAAGARLTRG